MICPACRGSQEHVIGKTGAIDGDGAQFSIVCGGSPGCHCDGGACPVCDGTGEVPDPQEQLCTSDSEL